MEAWKRAGREIHDDCGPRLMAIRLEVRCGQRGKQYKQMMGIFVISGYVVTGSLLREPSASPLQYLSAFYLRRLKRLLPALVCVIGLTSILMSVLIPPWVAALDDYYYSAQLAVTPPPSPRSPGNLCPTHHVHASFVCHR